ncbi:MAG: geranylgeranylglyceryl/heptaprenylglyceryl phosphate synthase [Candidatus Thermoplasmatota archaeon]|nr:geranylgeranylglyceryl/heptaprenylglyceryl phosphate synthase [Candidatus Thermoplasmatota archaeon]MBS3789452.1 geranylgeranylglyceryl/heptaprenylglyceryl phosphate synthase [Candidatus Thermoplasmatota archaeon]
MKVLDYILEKKEEETLHMGLIDPDEQSPEKSGELAQALEEVGSDAVMVGGSTGITQENLDKTVREMKRVTDLPIIHFPTEAGAISPHVDAIYFMSMLNSKDINRVIGEQVVGAPHIKKLGIQTLPMGYVVVEPGMTVGEVGKADLISRDDAEMAVNFGLAAQYLGMELFYLEAGSGAAQPIPVEMIKACKKNLDMTLIVGGGIRKPEQAKKRAEAGADVIVTGTVLEESSNIDLKLEKLIRALKEV